MALYYPNPQTNGLGGVLDSIANVLGGAASAAGAGFNIYSGIEKSKLEKKLLKERQADRALLERQVAIQEQIAVQDSLGLTRNPSPGGLGVSTGAIAVAGVVGVGLLAVLFLRR